MVKERGPAYEVESKKVDCPVSGYNILNQVFRLDVQPEEIFVMLCLNIKNEIIGSFEVSRGSLAVALVHPREVFKRALLCNAASILVAHNHPSGNSKPSIEDNSISKRLSEAGEMIGISVLDHIIVGDDNYYSYKEENPSLLMSHKNIGGNYV